MTTRTPNIQDVARMAGVSTQTVSNVLNRPERVRPETASRVRDAVDSLGYRAHAAARRLRTRRSDTIALRLPPMANGISGAILDVFLHELTARAALMDLRVLLYTAADHRDEITRLQGFVAAGDIDGVVLTGTSIDDPRPAWLAGQEVPSVGFGRPWGAEDLALHPWVDVDGEAGTAAAAAHLADGGGHLLAYLGWPGSSGQVAARRRGWQRTMVDRSLVPATDLESLAAAIPDNVEAALHATRHLLDLHGRLDGIVCASDSLAMGALLALGSTVPIIGFDNTPVARAVGLSSVDQRIDVVAQHVLDLLTDHGTVVRRPASAQVVAPELRVRRAVLQDPEEAPEQAGA